MFDCEESRSETHRLFEFLVGRLGKLGELGILDILGRVGFMGS